MKREHDQRTSALPAVDNQSGVVFLTTTGEGENSHPGIQIRVMPAPDDPNKLIVHSLIIGGMDKTLSMAKDLMPAFLRHDPDVTPAHGGWNVEEACEIALAAAEMLKGKYKLRQQLLQPVPTGLKLT